MKQFFRCCPLCVIFLLIPATVGFAQQNASAGSGPWPPVRIVIPQTPQPPAPVAAPTLTIKPALTINLIVYGQGGVVIVGNDIVTGGASLPPPGNKTPDNKMYRLQVGAFADTAIAQNCFNRLRSMGMNPACEQCASPYGSLRRIVIPAVAAAQVSPLVQRLEAAGFIDIWIREEP